MGLPTLFKKGVIETINDYIPKEVFENAEAMHYVIAILRHKLFKIEPNYDDMIFLLKSKTGTGKSTALIVAVRRSITAIFENEDAIGAIAGAMYREEIPGFDLTKFDFPDDEYTIRNRKKGELSKVVRDRKTIYCTQPKVLTAVGKAEEIARETFNPDLVIGENVGYTTGDFKLFPTKPDHIMYATLGSFTTMMKNSTPQEILKKFVICFIDECHIQSSELIVGLHLIGEFCRAVAGTPGAPIFVLMSATFDIEMYAKYLETSPYNSLMVEGSASDYEVFYHDEPVTSYTRAAADKIWKLHTENMDDTEIQNDIAVFVPGLGEITKIQGYLKEYDTKKETIVMKLDSNVVKKKGLEIAKIDALPLEEVKILTKTPNAMRRVIITTSVAETGITIPTLKYVILSGFNRTTAYSPTLDASALIDQPISKSSETQQAGRVGRLFRGQVHKLYTKEVSESFNEYSYPDTFSQDVTKDILDMLYGGVPESLLHDSLGWEKFIEYCDQCNDSDKPVLTKNNANCKSTYFNRMIIGSKIQCVNDYFENGTNVEFVDYPPRMLVNIPRDSYLVARARLVKLGLYGTYAGYVAGKMSRITVEGARMLITATGYGMSVNDAATLAALTTSKGDYRISKRDKDRKKLKAAYNGLDVYSEIMSGSVVKSSFGNVRNMIDSIRCDFVEAMVILKFIAKKAKSSRVKGVTGFMGICEKNGIMIDSIMEIVNLRLSLIKLCEDMGIVNRNPDIEFKKDIITDVARVKAVVYSGLKCNLAKKVEGKNGVYMNCHGVEIRYNIPGTAPNQIMYSRTFTKSSGDSIGSYTTNVILGSSLDGWI